MQGLQYFTLLTGIVLIGQVSCSRGEQNLDLRTKAEVKVIDSPTTANTITNDAEALKYTVTNEGLSDKAITNQRLFLITTSVEANAVDLRELTVSVRDSNGLNVYGVKRLAKTNLWSDLLPAKSGHYFFELTEEGRTAAIWQSEVILDVDEPTIESSKAVLLVNSSGTNSISSRLVIQDSSEVTCSTGTVVDSTKEEFASFNYLKTIESGKQIFVIDRQALSRNQPQLRLKVSCTDQAGNVSSIAIDVLAP